MKTFYILIISTTLFTLSCDKNEHKKINREEFNSLKIKLTATESQLSNLRIELAKCIGDSSSTVTEVK